ncbi:CCCH-type [Hexamita inflata]|uniref:CCCH-type n=1 Tax=Hexamita inflata TaxID=28002 RepID=A0AA86PT77_9EUKA|nr:CCCH-type [Hexamita inflata]
MQTKPNLKTKPQNLNICTQYAKTGYCIFGAECKHLHIRKENEIKVKKITCPECQKELVPGQTLVLECKHKICLLCFENGVRICKKCKAAINKVEIQ